MRGSPNKLALTLAVLALLVVPACSISMTLPADFLRLNTGGSELKATTPDDGRLWVREFNDPDQGDLAFWARTLENQLIEQRGYRLIEKTDVQDAEARPGVQMHCTVTREGEPHGYLVVVFVVEGMWSNTIRVAEFTARQPVFDENVGSVKSSIPTLR